MKGRRKPEAKFILVQVIKFLPPIFQIISIDTLFKLIEQRKAVVIYNCYPIFAPFLILTDIFPVPRIINKVIAKIIQLSRKRWPGWKTVIVK